MTATINPLEVSAEVAPTQLLVLGRGMEDHSTIGSFTLARVLAAANYCNVTPGIQRVVLSGNGTGRTDGSRLTEAQAMASAIGFPDGIEVLPEPTARTTVENFLNATSEGLLVPGELTGVVAHSNHLPRVMWLGQRALGLDYPLQAIVAEDFGAEPEKHGSARIERVNFAFTRGLLYLGVHNSEDMQKREKRISGFKGRVKGGLALVKVGSEQY